MGDRLAGKVALITGASQGIGAEIARRFGAAGARVVVAYFTSHDRGHDVAAEIRRTGGKAIAVRADLRDPQQIDHLMDEVAGVFEQLDILVNNAAVSEVGELADITPEHVERLLSLNVRALLQLTRAAVPRFGAEGGRIINISSRNGIHPVPGAAVYCATKAAVNAITVSLAQELGTRRITVNAIAPGPTDTPSFRQRLSEDDERDLLDRTPLGRLGLPSDVANIALFLASEDGFWISGEVISATGGLQG